MEDSSKDNSVVRNSPIERMSQPSVQDLAEAGPSSRIEEDDMELLKAKLKKDKEAAFLVRLKVEKEKQAKRRQICNERRKMKRKDSKKKVNQTFDDQIKSRSDNQIKSPVICVIKSTSKNNAKEMVTDKGNMGVKAQGSSSNYASSSNATNKLPDTDKVFQKDNIKHTGKNASVNRNSPMLIKIKDKKVNTKGKNFSLKTLKEKRQYEMEKKKLQREKIRNDPVAHEAYKAKEKMRNERRKAEGKLKSIAQMNERQKRRQRKMWRQNKEDAKKRKQEEKERVEEAEMAVDLFDSPPATPNSGQSTNSANKRRGRKRLRRDRTKLYRELLKQKAALKSANALVEKWKKRCYKQREARNEVGGNKKSPTPRKKVEIVLKKGAKEVRKRLLFGEALSAQLKQKSKSLKTFRDKQIFYKVLSGDVLKKYKCAVQAEFLKKNSERKYRTKDPVPIQYKRNERRSNMSQHEKILVRQFLEKDIHSCLAPGKKDAITRNKQRKQKRFLLESLKNLHKKFHRTVKQISYSSFCRLKPFWILPPAPGNRNTCLCIKHENFKMIVEKLHRIKTNTETL